MEKNKEETPTGNAVLDHSEQVTHGQAAMLVYSSAIGNIVYTFTFVTSVTGRPFWAAVWLGVLANLPLALWMVYLSRKIREGNLFHLLKNGLGKTVCNFIIIVYILINIAVAICMLNMFTGVVRVYFLQTTPLLAIMIFLLLICALFAYSGIKTIGRWAQIMSVLFTVNYFLGFFLSFINQFKTEYVFPIFDTTFIQFAAGAYITMATVAEGLLFLMLLTGNMAHTKKHRLSVVKGITVWSVILSVAIFIMEGDVGSETLSSVAQAGVTVSRVIQVNDFIRGLEILVLMTYQYIAVIKITMYIYSCYETAKMLFNAKKSILLLIVCTVLILIPSVFISSFNSGYYYSILLGCYIIFPFTILVLILASVSVKLVKKKESGGLTK